MGFATILAALSSCLVAVAADSPRAARRYPPDMPEASAETYRTVDDVELKLYLFNPEGHKPQDHRPAIVFYFGGGWRGGSPGQFRPQCRYLASRGMVAIAADYRVASRHGVKPADCVRDAKAAIRWVRREAERLGIDPDRIVASGGSAGGHLAACTGIVPGFDDEGSPSSVPNALALFNPAVMLAPFQGDTLLDEKRAARYRALTGGKPESISPIHHVRSGLPPTIIFHGTADAAVPYATVERFTAAMKSAGNRCELVGFDGQPHGFFNPGRGRTKNGGANGDEMYRRTLRLLDEFLISLGYLDGEPTVAAGEAGHASEKKAKRTTSEP